MKKISFVIGGLVLLALEFVPRSDDFQLSFLQLANIEALSIPEEGDGGDEVVKCYCKTNWFSPNICTANGDGAYCGGDPCSNHDANCR